MPKSCLARLLSIFILAFALLACFVLLMVDAELFQILPRLPGHQAHRQKLRVPHQIPQHPGGIGLRLAMVHDTIQERFAVQGPAYYEKRNQITKQALKKQIEATPGSGQRSTTYFSLVDDLAVGLEKLGRSREAAEEMRRKLDEQEKQGLKGRELYTTYANLGTFLVHWQMQEGLSDRTKARDRLKEGLSFLHRAIAVNPQAHFGREIWQAVVLEFNLACLENPHLRLKYDMVGNRLAAPVEGNDRECSDHSSVGHYTRRYTWPGSHFESLTDDEREHLRVYIIRVGAEDGWTSEVPSSHKEPVPFDEPTLGIIGMWRLGGGANPHFALALGEIMLRVGQRHIAWTAYERAILLAPKFSPNKETVDEFVAHCRRRQESIERELPAEEVANLRPRFQRELAFGQQYQKAYQEYEAKRIGEGADIDDPHFYDDFHTEHGPIASRSGDEEYLIRLVRTEPWPEAVLLLGVVAFVGACCYRFWPSRHAGRSVSTEVQ